MEKIIAAGNVEVPCFLAIQAMGYSIKKESLDAGTENEREIWIGEKEGIQISGFNPVELLGIITMRSERGNEWKASDNEIESYLEKYYPNASNE